MPAEDASPRAGSPYPIWKHVLLDTGYFADAKFRHDSEPVIESRASVSDERTGAEAPIDRLAAMPAAANVSEEKTGAHAPCGRLVVMPAAANVSKEKTGAKAPCGRLAAATSCGHQIVKRR